MFYLDYYRLSGQFYAPAQNKKKSDALVQAGKPEFLSQGAWKSCGSRRCDSQSRRRQRIMQTTALEISREHRRRAQYSDSCSSKNKHHPCTVGLPADFKGPFTSLRRHWSKLDWFCLQNSERPVSSVQCMVPRRCEGDLSVVS